MNIEELQILAQLIEAMNDCERKLEEYYQKRDIENFKKSKKTLLEFQRQAADILK